jgi:hypothetical protein
MSHLFCPRCGQEIEVAESAIGSLASCPKCHTSFVVPIRHESAAPPAAKVRSSPKGGCLLIVVGILMLLLGTFTSAYLNNNDADEVRRALIQAQGGFQQQGRSSDPVKANIDRSNISATVIMQS